MLKSATRTTIAVTPGEPAGIGPDLLIQLLQTGSPGQADLVAVCDPELLHSRAEQLRLPLEIIETADGSVSEHSNNSPLIHVLPVKMKAAARCGELNVANGGYVLETLRIATRGCLEGRFRALVTGPVHKGVINEAGVPFTGHTEFLAEQSETPLVVMMLATEGLRVALATTHLPLREIADAINKPLLKRIISILNHDLQTKMGINQPKILVCGLNPHAGEDGHLGREEIEIINPVLEQMRAEGIDLTGPLPADTLFVPKYLEQADAVLAMYHDQGLPVLKHKGFGQAVNITLGLPFIRTSVDHGTALALAGSGKAEIGSLQTAIDYAVDMAQRSEPRP